MSHPLIFLDFITRTVLGEEYRSLSSSLCSFLHSTVTSSWKISTFCPNNVSPCFLMYLSVNSDYFNTEHRHLRWHHGRQYVYFRRHVVVWRGSVKTPDVLKLGVCVCVCIYIDGVVNAASFFGRYICYDAVLMLLEETGFKSRTLNILNYLL